MVHLAGKAEASYLHATAVLIGEAGLLIRGPSGAGKSNLAFALIAAAETAGIFARLLGDDRIGVILHGGRLIAHGHPSILGKIERRGQGIVEVPFLARAVLRLVICLSGAGEMPARYPEPDSGHILLLGVKLPVLLLRQDAALPAQAFTLLADLRLRRILL
ncbi:MAG: aldolase [Beijerinckiaceae bacterium]|nr:aldolase [Beijerinckiaceae bacterium]MCI0736695.1 aldolase [Beijerinckiaceae bacterium]